MQRNSKCKGSEEAACLVYSGIRKEAIFLKAMMQSYCSSLTFMGPVGLDVGLNVSHPVILFTPSFIHRVWSQVAGVRRIKEGMKEKEMRFGAGKYRWAQWGSRLKAPAPNKLKLVVSPM